MHHECSSAIVFEYWIIYIMKTRDIGTACRHALIQEARTAIEQYIRRQYCNINVLTSNLCTSYVEQYDNRQFDYVPMTIMNILSMYGRALE